MMELVVVVAVLVLGLRRSAARDAPAVLRTTWGGTPLGTQERSDELRYLCGVFMALGFPRRVGGGVLS